jgi:hypothetical protein
LYGISWDIVRNPWIISGICPRKSKDIPGFWYGIFWDNMGEYWNMGFSGIFRDLRAVYCE